MATTPAPASSTRSGRTVSSMSLPASTTRTAVGWAALNDITTGTDPTHFSPSDLVTRAQFATFLWRMVCEPAAAGEAPFVDLVAGSFYEAAVDWLWSAGFTNGRTPELYVPQGALTRAEFATFVFRLAGEPGGAPSSGFADVVAGSFYAGGGRLAEVARADDRDDADHVRTEPGDQSGRSGHLPLSAQPARRRHHRSGRSRARVRHRPHGALLPCGGGRSSRERVGLHRVAGWLTRAGAR